jgi:hypothetical protein
MMADTKIVFETLIDEAFAKVSSDKSLSPVDKKRVLSLINDFEDGEWRYSTFQNFIWDNIAETALSFRERESLIGQSHSLLVAAAKNLRLTDKSTDEKGRGSELAEIFLYGIMRHHYKSLPVVPKIFYKQSSQDYAKGADSVHIVLEGNSDFSLWLGEAKFYDNIEDARLDRIVASVEGLLDTKKIRKENSIITSVSDIDDLIQDNVLRTRIKTYLSPSSSIDDLKPKLHIPILLLHECSITKACTCLSDDYKGKMIKYHTERAESYFSKQIKKLGGNVFKYGEITFHLVLFPVPSKKSIVEKFVTNVKHFKDQ